MVIIKSLVKSDESLLVMPVSYETHHPCLKLTKGLYVSESNLPTFLVLACTKLCEVFSKVPFEVQDYASSTIMD